MILLALTGVVMLFGVAFYLGLVMATGSWSAAARDGRIPLTVVGVTAMFAAAFYVGLWATTR